MKVQHATLGGNITKRDMKRIDKKVIDVFKIFQLEECFQKELYLPHSDLKVRITKDDVGAMFHMVKCDEIIVTNFCCFDKLQKKQMIALIEYYKQELPDFYSRKGDHFNVLGDKFLYSIPILSNSLSIADMLLCGEVEFYIYHALYLAHREYKIKTIA